MTTSEPSLLEEAAAELRAARDDNRRREEDTRVLAETHPERMRIRAVRLRIAEGFLAAAAIEAGLPPRCHHPESEQDPQ